MLSSVGALMNHGSGWGQGGVDPISITATTIPENAGANTVVGTLDTVWPGELVTWTLTDDASGTFIIWGGKRNQIALNWVQLDRAVATSYDVTVRATAGAEFLERTITITVTAVDTPADASIGVSHVAVDFRHGVVVSGVNITSADPAWSAPNGVSGNNNPVLGNNGPSGQPVARLSADAWFGFTGTGAVSAFEFSAIFCSQGTALCPILAASSSTTNYIRLRNNGAGGYNQAQVRHGTSASDITVNFNTTILPGALGRLGIVFDGTTLSFTWDGATIGSTASASGQTFSFNRIGRLASVTSTCDFFLFAFALYTAATLTTDDRVMLAAWWEPWRRNRTWVSHGGDDTSKTPWLQATPYLTIAAAYDKALISGDAILLDDDAPWYESITSASGSGGTSLSPVKVGPWPGATPTVDGAEPWATAWTDIGSNQWTTTLAYDPEVAWALTGTAGTPTEYTWIVNRALSQDWSMQWAANTLTAQFPAGFDPNVEDIRICSQTDSRGILSSRQYIICYDLTFRFWSSYGVRPTGGVAECWRVVSKFNGDDGFGPSTQCSLYECTSWRNGLGSHTGGSGDGASWHSSSNGYMWLCDLRMNDYGGVRCEQYASVVVDGGVIQGNKDAQVIWLPQGTGDREAGCTLNSVLIIMDDNQIASTACIEWPATLNNRISLNVYGCTIVYMGSSKAGKTAISMLGGDDDNVAEWNIIKGFGTGILADTGFDIAEDYNCFHDNTANISGAAVSQGGNSFTADPLFTNAASEDYSLQSGSPCLGAAVGSTQTITADGRQRPAPMAIGAYERLSS